ncbi:cytochrome d ubiquinol oxidase subunit II [Pseudarthrobacter phenanthrenivorans]|uniref:Cytochrome d ubiquinol oxidase subunit II n=2 Tax=Bacteria TaxID=2 RepID=A0A3B0FJL1_PSEPS|nr:cytochrome d ubiquinol oxidase subunit II [Pseudarthrobacter phenanthrenivorans]RKO20045.1 cytochrome d ubiquinol oxidase subunit II [Pseudarthrobacter phenanthrenivorans]
MPLAELLMAAMWICLTAYALFGGADFGGGFWDLIAGRAEKGRAQRNLIEHSIGPIWEANHVWLIFVIILTWTVVPSVFAAVSSTLYIPLTLVALGIIARGSAFAFRKVSQKLWQQRLFGGAFALSSVLTPFFLGTVGGSLASGRVPPGIAAGDPITSWINPTSLISGVLAVTTTAYLAAVYLTHDARREGDPALAETFRRKALAAGVATGVVAGIELLVLAMDAPGLFGQLLAMPAAPLAALSIAAGAASLALMWRRNFLTVRISAALAVTALLWSWGIAQYPYVLPGLALGEASATENVLVANAIAVVIAGILVIPSLWWLYAIFQRDEFAKHP